MAAGHLISISLKHSQSLHRLYWPMLDLLDSRHFIRTNDWFHINSCMVLLDGIYLAHKFNGNIHMKICRVSGYGCIENADFSLLYCGLIDLIYLRIMAFIQFMIWKSGSLLILMVLVVLLLALLYKLYFESYKDLRLKSARIRFLITHE
eukprot:767857_1